MGPYCCYNTNLKVVMVGANGRGFGWLCDLPLLSVRDRIHPGPTLKTHPCCTHPKQNKHENAYDHKRESSGSGCRLTGRHQQLATLHKQCTLPKKKASSRRSILADAKMAACRLLRSTSDKTPPPPPPATSTGLHRPPPALHKF